MSVERNKNAGLMRYAGLATQWLFLLGIALWGGFKLDEKLHFRALFIIILPVVVLIISLWQLIRTLNKPKA